MEKTLRITCIKGDLSVDFELAVPELEGSEKQIVWAEDIRRRAIEYQAEILLEQVSQVDYKMVDERMAKYNCKTLSEFAKFSIETAHAQTPMWSDCDYYVETSAKAIIEAGKSRYRK